MTCPEYTILETLWCHVPWAKFIDFLEEQCKRHNLSVDDYKIGYNPPPHFLDYAKHLRKVFNNYPANYKSLLQLGVEYLIERHEGREYSETNSERFKSLLSSLQFRRSLIEKKEEK